MASGVEALKMATYFLQDGRGRHMDNIEVVKAKEVGAGKGFRPKISYRNKKKYTFVKDECKEDDKWDGMRASCLTPRNI